MPWIVLGIVVILAAAGMWYVVGQGDSDINTNVVVVNTNAAVNTSAVANENVNAETNTNTATIDTSDWQTYVSATLHLSFQYPFNWSVVEKSVSGGSFEAEEATYSLVIEPKNNTLDFPPAGRCVLQVFPSLESETLTDWVGSSILYGRDGSLTILSREEKQLGNLNTLEVLEGGQNAQRTISLYFYSPDRVDVDRYGYFVDVDAQPREDFQSFSDTCEKISSTFAGG